MKKNSVENNKYLDDEFIWIIFFLIYGLWKGYICFKDLVVIRWEYMKDSNLNITEIAQTVISFLKIFIVV